MAKSRYTAVWCTDVGLRKSINEDSALILQAESLCGPVLLAAICDGMGGLSRGELASATGVRALKEWFTQQLPYILEQSNLEEALSGSWSALVQTLNERISAYGENIHIQLGTTMTVLLLVGRRYYILNVGDSRAYLLSDTIYQLTHDQTLVQREIDEGRLTPEEAEDDPRRSILLQCIGASETVVPDFFAGDWVPGQRFLLCCDGFRHVIKPQEMQNNLNPANAPDQTEMERSLQLLVDLNKERCEVDNITAVLIAT